MRANRLLSLLLMLQARGRMTGEEMALELGVSVRTVYRDLQALAEAGVPVLTERGRGGGCQLHPRYRTGLTGLSSREAEALFALSAPVVARDVGLEGPLTAGRRKLVAALPARRAARERIHVDPAGWFRSTEDVPCLRPLFDAVWAERRVTIRHHHHQGPSRDRGAEPLGLVVKGGAWYLVAGTEDGLRVFRVSRIESVSSPGERFRPPHDFDLVAFWSSWAEEFESRRQRVDVTLRVAPGALGRLPRYATPTNGTVEEADGWTRITLAFETLEHARPDLLALGPSVEVVEPAELRESVAAEARETVALYSRSERA